VRVALLPRRRPATAVRVRVRAEKDVAKEREVSACAEDGVEGVEKDRDGS
jgi:hypothetical protein